MRCQCFVAAVIALSAAFAAETDAQRLQSPSSVVPIGFYDYYEGAYQEPGGSPSDQLGAENQGGDAEVAPLTAELCAAETECCCTDSCSCCNQSSCNCSCMLGCCEGRFRLFPVWNNCWCKKYPALSCQPDDPGSIVIRGWVNPGFHDGTIPLSFTRGDLLSFGDVPRAQLNQMYLYTERSVDGSNGFEWGYRLDVMYGTDAQKMQAFGNSLSFTAPPAAGGVGPFTGPGGWDNKMDNGVYGWAIPQAYLEAAQGDWSVKAGHFFTLVGYEVITAPGNFFYSHAYTMFNSEPFTHTGIVATYGGVENVELYGGWTLGWDTGFDKLDSGSSWLGGASVTLTDDVTLTYISTAGNFGLRGRDAYSHSLVLDVALTDNINWVMQSDMVSIRMANLNGVAAPAGAFFSNSPAGNDQVGINNYLFYTLSDTISVGGRMEWWKSDGISYHEITGGVNWKPHSNIVVRPEIRYDWTPARAPDLLGNGGGGYSIVTGNPNATNIFDVTTFSIDAIIQF